LISQKRFDFDFLETIWLYPLDYEEFLAYEHKFDSTALNHYLQLGGLTCMHKLQAEERVVYIQQKLKYHLLPIEFEVLKFIAKYNAQKISPYSIYERLKSHIKISKDKTYASYKELFEKKYFFEVEKFEQKKAVKKLYLCDIFLKTALSIDKHFGRLFENLIFLELYKKHQNIFYHDNIDFYLPNEDEIIFCKPFADERRLFKKLETIEAFLFSYNVKKVTAITMNKEGSLSHPLCKVEIIPFDIWALGD
jgi:predicted AAA+ superfamily ATPase